MKDDVKELFYQSMDYTEDLIFIIVKETIRLFDLSYGFARSFYEAPYNMFDLHFIRHDRKVGFRL